MRSLPAKWSMCPAHDWNAKSHDRMVRVGFRECLTGKAFPRNILFCYFVIFDTPYLYPHYIYSYYPHMLKSVFQRENPSHNLWELKIVIPTIYCGFSQLLHLYFQILEKLIAQTLTTPILCVKRGFGTARKYWKKSSFGGYNRAYCGI